MNSSGPPVAAFLALAAVVGVIALIAWAVERGRIARFREFAVQDGWLDVAGTPLGAPPIEAARCSGRSKAVLSKRIDGQPVVLSWHQWTEQHTSRHYVSDSRMGHDGHYVHEGRWEDRTTSTTHDLTRYFVSLADGGWFPDATVKRRTALGGWLRPVRGVGTGDGAFDRAFLVVPGDDPAVCELLTPELRRAMMAGEVPLWGIENGTLVIEYGDRPTVRNLTPRAEAAARIANCLTAPDR